MDTPSRRKWDWRAPAVGLLIVLVLCVMGSHATTPRPRETAVSQQPGSPAPNLGRASDLPHPGGLAVPQFEKKLFEFLNTRRYVELGWLQDKAVRDTGPYIAGKSYGTHPAVRVFYSPGVIRWLMNGRSGRIADGEMIIKEQYPAPAIRHQGKNEEALWDSLESWTVMVKDSSGSQDGWFWSNPAKGQCVVDNHQYPFDHPLSGFGHYCVRCHASVQSPGATVTGESNEFTFASLRNVKGFPGEPLQFRVDDSWRNGALKTKADALRGDDRRDSHSHCVRPALQARSNRIANPGFLKLFPSIRQVGHADVLRLPPVTHDWVVAGRDPNQEFVTSNQCMSCHSALVAPFGPSMFVSSGKDAEFGGPGRDVSPHGEWRWSPMGLAGRDPVFLAQIESEIHAVRNEFQSDPALADELGATISETCLRCHGAMGRRLFDLDHTGSPTKFSLEHAYGIAGPAEHLGRGQSLYGALARDGVGCVVCHRMQPLAQPPNDHRPALQHFLETSVSGNFHLGTKGEIYGPFRDDAIASYVMEHATGLKPKQGDFIRSSRLCGTCHTVALPNVDRPLDPSHPDLKADELTRSEVVPLFRKFHHHVEQATYVEWLNSEFENEINVKNPRARSCQDCHMARGLRDDRNRIDIPQLQTRIAAIQDTTYPEAENLAPHDQLNIPIREDGYKRHNFSGLNVFLLTLFDQFDDVLGVRKTDYMTGSAQGIGHAVDDMARMARDEVASLDVEAGWQGPSRVIAHVVVKNKVGHRFPSGVGFRRAFLELAVIEPADLRKAERVVWASGRTNEFGVLLGADGLPLTTEFFARDPSTGRQRYQGHHEVISSPDQVQIYETLLRDAKGRFTTSFVHGCATVKDNRLLPRGWKKEGPGNGLTGRFLQATYPGPDAAKDPRYLDGSGSDEVTYRIELPRGLEPTRLQIRATLYYQAIPPYFLRNLFETAPDGPATRRLHHICSEVDLKGTPIENWKLPIARVACQIDRRPLSVSTVRSRASDRSR